jgi:hypothetical protein
MGKQLKVAQMTSEQESHFRARLNNVKKKTLGQVEFYPSMKYIPASLHAKAVNDPSTFTSRLKSKDESKLMMEFVKHCYNKYKVPKILDQAWNFNLNQAYRNSTYKFEDWYICVATGGSLYKEYCKDFMTKKEVFTFLSCPHDITLSAALVYAIAIGFGASVGIALKISRSKLSEKNFKDEYHGKFWRDVIHFFVMNPPEKYTEIDDLCDFLMHKRRQNLDYSILGQGYTLKSMQKKMKDWHYELARAKAMGDATWEGRDIPDFEVTLTNNEKVTWKMTQIKTTKDLHAEGNAMHHCVYSYKQSCINGWCSIWSLKSYDKWGVEKRRLTIELGEGNYIRQIRGYANRLAKPEEMKVVNMWTSRHGLYAY